MKKVFVFFIVLVVIFLIWAVIFLNKIKEPYKGYLESDIKIEVKRGMSIGDIVSLLKKKRIIKNKFYLKIYLKIYLPKVTFKAGEYMFENPLSIKQVVIKLKEGNIVLYKLTVKEGLTLEQTAELVNRERKIDRIKFIEICKDKSLIMDLDPLAEDLEGYLYPDTYSVRKGITAKELIKLMVNQFREQFNNKMKWQARELGFSLREVIILASLIEKETSLREERFLISSVFHNRLRIGMALGCDPTIIYALMKEGKYNGKLGWADLKFGSPYNTRLNRGLPPGPICSPGFHSIEGALYPKKTHYLYFVAKDDKSHYFSKSLREHNKAVRKYIINR